MLVFFFLIFLCRGIALTAGAEAGTAQVGRELAGRELVVMTFNIHHGVGRDGKLDLERIAVLIRESGADLVGLQEVDRHFLPRSAFQDQVQELARRLGMVAAFSPSLTRPALPFGGEGSYGNALLSRYPLAGVQSFRFPSRWETRSALVAIFAFAGEFWQIAVTHLGLDAEERCRDVKTLLGRLVPGLPTLVLGDWNATPSLPEVRAVTVRFQDTYLAAWRRRGPRGTILYGRPLRPTRIDYIFASPGLFVSEHRVIPTQASDHWPVTVRVRRGAPWFHLEKPGYLP